MNRDIPWFWGTKGSDTMNSREAIRWTRGNPENVAVKPNNRNQGDLARFVSVEWTCEKQECEEEKEAAQLAGSHSDYGLMDASADNCDLERAKTLLKWGTVNEPERRVTTQWKRAENTLVFVRLNPTLLVAAGCTIRNAQEKKNGPLQRDREKREKGKQGRQKEQKGLHRTLRQKVSTISTKDARCAR